jgi:outer membrane protein OmpA-like peptidoglycan-associated protein
VRPFIALIFLFSILACSSKPNTIPDNTAGGAVLGSGIGAGAGMVVGHQIGHIGPGAAVGAGIGLISGALTGYSQDRLESNQAEMSGELSRLKAQTNSNRTKLKELQAEYDLSSYTELPLELYQVFFEDNATSINEGALHQLEKLADVIKRSRAAIRVEVSGHSDESGSDKYNQELSELRARNVATYLKSRGVSAHAFDIIGFGSNKPVASNKTAEGRQLNRRVEVRISR